LAAAVWHIISFQGFGGLGGWPRHIGLLSAGVSVGLVSLHLHRMRGLADYLEPVKPFMFGASILLLGSAHFIGLMNTEPLFLQMGFMVLMLAYYEAVGMASGFRPAYSPRAADVTKGTLKRLALKQFGLLAMVFGLSVAMLYLSLTAVMGFTQTWTVTLLAAAMIFALALLARARRI